MTVTMTMDPHAVLDFVFDWTAWLAESETLASYEIVPSTGVTVDSHAEVDGVITAWLSEPTGRKESVTCRVVTDQGRTDDRTIVLRVTER